MLGNYTENNGKNNEFVAVVEMNISCLLKEPACSLLASDFGEIVLQTFIFGRRMAKHLSYISLLEFGICLQVASSPPRLTAALTIDTLGEPHGYTSCYGRMGSSMHKIHSLHLS